jgi:hypothetical protein
VDDWIDDSGVSKVASSLIFEELPLGIDIGGVILRSSKLYQKPSPPECLIAWLVNVLDDERRLPDASPLIMISSAV